MIKRMCCSLVLLNCLLIGNVLRAESFENQPAGYVTVKLMGQLGNQLFQIATAYAYSLDYGMPLLVPDLQNSLDYNIPENAKRLFLDKIDSRQLPSHPDVHWSEPDFNYTKIPFASKNALTGYFQSEKYFKHRRKEILELFSPSKELKERILDKYPYLISDRLVVGVQIRDYRQEQPEGRYHPTKNRSYYERAVSYFPEDAIFIVSSNNAILAKECMDGLRPNIVYLEGSDYIEDFYTLVQCKSFIISNSSFGWWASWLSIAPNKVVVAPGLWFSPPFDNSQQSKDRFAEGFTVIDL